MHGNLLLLPVFIGITLSISVGDSNDWLEVLATLMLVTMVTMLQLGEELSSAH
jgi:hypothetical protein